MFSVVFYRNRAVFISMEEWTQKSCGEDEQRKRGKRMGKILLVDSDLTASGITKQILETREYDVFAADTLTQAREFLEQIEFDLILLEMLLPDGEGIEFCREIRKKSFCPIIFISSLAKHRAKIAALQAGADDYVVKPANLEELIARIQANIRRFKEYDPKKKKKELVCKGFLIRKQIREVWRTDADGQPTELIPLTPIEYGLLLYLVEYAGELISYHMLYQQIWQEDDWGDTRTVMVHVFNLRKKLGAVGRESILNVRGKGYIFKRYQGFQV